jgi:vacuolar-type H+-ATPase subunit E/Vma4
MVRDGKEQNNEELSTAAAVLNQYIFGTTKFTHPTNLSQEDINDESKKKEDAVTQREKDLIEKTFNNARDDLGTRVDNILKSSVDKAIDPADSMTEFVKRTATREVLEGLEDLISRDTRFRTIYDKLWERAFENDFDKESMDKVKKAYLSKAQTLLPVLIKRARNEALKGLSRKASDDNGKDKRGPLPVGKTRSSATLASGKSNSGNNSKSVPRGMSTLEYLNSDE